MQQGLSLTGIQTLEVSIILERWDGVLEYCKCCGVGRVLQDLVTHTGKDFRLANATRSCSVYSWMDIRCDSSCVRDFSLLVGLLASSPPRSRFLPLVLSTLALLLLVPVLTSRSDMVESKARANGWSSIFATQPSECAICTTAIFRVLCPCLVSPLTGPRLSSFDRGLSGDSVTIEDKTGERIHFPYNPIPSFVFPL
ncbi:hypothetical protein CPB86DRAFT_220192 [Serendipita vermifera]|nr:hypothetical protein CPB86DRAFT_220192 [Serendipita vermifera]